MSQTVLHTSLFHITVSSTFETSSTSCLMDDEVQMDVAIQRNGSDDGEPASEPGESQRRFERALGDEDAKRRTVNGGTQGSGIEIAKGAEEHPGDSNDQEASESRKRRRSLERALGDEDAKRRGVDSSGQQSGAENIPGPEGCTGDGTDQDGGVNVVIFGEDRPGTAAADGPHVSYF